MFQSVLNIEVTNTYCLQEQSNSVFHGIQVRGASAQQSPSIADIAQFGGLEQDQASGQIGLQLDNKDLIIPQNEQNPLFYAGNDILKGNQFAADFLENLNIGDGLEMSPNFGANEMPDANFLNEFGNLAEVSKKIFQEKVFNIDEIMNDEEAEDGANRLPNIQQGNNKEERRKLRLERLILGNDAKVNEKSNKFRNRMQESDAHNLYDDLNTKLHTLRLDFKKETLGGVDGNPVEALLADSGPCKKSIENFSGIDQVLLEARKVDLLTGVISKQNLHSMMNLAQEMDVFEEADLFHTPEDMDKVNDANRENMDMYLEGEDAPASFDQSADAF